MPRDVGTGLYHYPDGTPGNPGQTVFSARYNTFINDLANTLNQPLPINMGGTSGTSLVEARANLFAEVASAQVSDYNTHVWESGSFHSFPGVAGAPSGGNIGGTSVILDAPINNHINLEARDNATGIVYRQQKVGGVWSGWTSAMTVPGNVTITSSQPQLIVNGIPGNAASIVGQKNGLNRWQIKLGDESTETGIGNAGANFVVLRYTDLGVPIGNVFHLNRSTGDATFIANVSTPTLLSAGEANVTTSGHAALTLNTTVAANGNFIIGQENGSRRWVISPGGFGATKHFGIERYNDLGATQGYSFSIDRATNATNISGTLSVNGDVDVTTPAHAILKLNTMVAGNGNHIIGQENGFRRWVISPGVAGATKDFGIERYNDAGISQGYSFSIDRTTNAAHISGAFSVTGVTTLASSTLCGSTTLSSFYATIKAGWPTGYTAILLRPETNSSGNAIAFQNATDATVGAITCTASATTYATSSDERLKEDLKSFDAGNIVDDTNVYDFAWKSTGERSYGILAQQAIKVYPTAVTYTEEQDWYGIDYSKYVPVILQELKALRARVAELEGKLGAKPA